MLFVSFTILAQVIIRDFSLFLHTKEKYWTQNTIQDTLGKLFSHKWVWKAKKSLLTPECW